MNLPTNATFAGPEDVITYLTEQHLQIKALFTRAFTSGGDEREAAFFELRRLLAVHETAEERLVHPEAAKAIADGETIVSQRLGEERGTASAIAQLEALPCDSAAFTQLLTRLQADVTQHADREEEFEFKELAGVLGLDQLQAMERVVAVVETIPPTRPCPDIHGQAANLLGGPFSEMVVRVRAAL